ncbi:hypothetical protein LZQ00_11800 [Sphingobacterium sp. SRCM116780]|uniref:hypothetical protein n=1 Tax=Sphingobacterium sp. SRCM116780 TaxID=2907623 RepID=UPI001F3A4267|nr:hypothetical protein [Sphingobacterium sp. SRCM116780]UIR54962.1 hypothetical protein LZQ00_11800 [Sphingobacterium sp. SRCM116780]
MMSKVKNILVVFCFCIIGLSSTYAQDNERFQMIENEKVAFITRELNLSRNEAQQFFPIYNEYSKQMWSVKKAKTGNGSPKNSLRGGGSRDVIAYDAKEVEIKKSYREKFAKVIGNARASQFFQVEQEFREYLIKSLNNRR